MSEMIFGDLRHAVPTPWVQILLAVVAATCGAIVGVEREKREKPAGLRTLVLVCLGSATFTMVSYAFTSNTGDSGRVAAQVVTGIGFLGAGAILHGVGFVTGMTTATTIWATAATGMVVGTGHAGAGLGLSVFVRLILSGVRVWESRRLGDLLASEVVLVVRPDGGKTRIRIEKLMEDFNVPDALAETLAVDDDLLRLTLRFHMPRRHRREFLHALAETPAVIGISDNGPRSSLSRPR